MEVPVNQIFDSRTGISSVGTETPAPCHFHHQALFSHRLTHYFLREVDAAPSQCTVNTMISVTTIVAMEDVVDGAALLLMLSERVLRNRL